ncbi:MAG TPA: hypothetical protein VE734_03095, partial [Terriglobales bacterium]|nr:hypothetical protein [Terriglobales bacterium]
MDKRKHIALLLVLGLMLVAGCGKKEAPQEQASSKQEAQQAAAPGGKVDPATAATISGVVK